MSQMNISSIFGFYYMVGLLSHMGWPRKRGLFSFGTVYDSNVLELAEAQMITWSASIGACRPNLALQMIATMFRENNWDSSDSIDICDLIDDLKVEWGANAVARNFVSEEGEEGIALLDDSENAWRVWSEYEDSNLELKDVVQFFEFSKFSSMVNSKNFTKKETRFLLEQVCLDSLLWGLANPEGFKNYFEKQNQHHKDSMPIYEKAGLDIDSIPGLEQLLKEGEAILRSYEKEIRPLSPIPQKLTQNYIDLFSTTK